MLMSMVGSAFGVGKSKLFLSLVDGFILAIDISCVFGHFHSWISYSLNQIEPAAG